MEEVKNGFPSEIVLEKGLEACGGSPELYQSVIGVFISEGRKKLPLIKQLYKQEDWENYIVAVHGLKSSAASIGAMELSGHAKEMEFAGKDKNYELIYEKTELLLNEYVAMLQKLTAFSKKYSEEEQVKLFEEYC